jgi:hypothetical protein
MHHGHPSSWRPAPSLWPRAVTACNRDPNYPNNELLYMYDAGVFTGQLA